MLNTPTRLLHTIALLCLAAVAVALVSQHIFNMPPCAWCVLQRLIYLAVAIVCWLGVLAGRWSLVSQRIAAMLAMLLSIAGVAAAWFQYTVAAHMFSCDQTFADKFMVKSGLDSGLPWLFGIFASCMDARVNLLGIEYALWSLGLFVICAVLALAALLRRS
jgi:disulfide bond formation protein DsbB